MTQRQANISAEENSPPPFHPHIFDGRPYHDLLSDIARMVDEKQYQTHKAFRASTIRGFLVGMAGCPGASYDAITVALSSLGLVSVQKSNGGRSWPARPLRKALHQYMADFESAWKAWAALSQEQRNLAIGRRAEALRNAERERRRARTRRRY